MSLPLFQTFCLVVLTAAYALDGRAQAEPRRRLATIALLALAAGLGEHTVIAAYGYYTYTDGWWLRIGHVPLLVPLIWPLVVLSARQVVQALWPDGGSARRALRVAAVVAFDASIIEVCAVAAGFWQWREGGYLGVPLIGLAGWGCFAFAASLWLDARESRDGVPRTETPTQRAVGRLGPLAPVALAAATHGLILLLWWGIFRWAPRADLGPTALWAFAALAVGYGLAVGIARRRRPALGGQVTLARGLATSVFVALLLTLPEPTQGPVFAHFGLAALPYLWASVPYRVRLRGAAARSAQEDVLGQPGP